LNAPLVSIGLPVYNGEKYIGEAIESFVNQSFTDWELLISDNASTDNTQEICLDWCEKDRRITYHQNMVNVGSSKNYTIVFEKSIGKYFKWTGHDDVYDRTYLEQCVRALEKDPKIVLCHSRIVKIDHEGKLLVSESAAPVISDPDPYVRFKSSLEKAWDYVWGVGRRDVFARTRLLGPFVHHDIPFISALSLFGNLYEIPETLCQIREHPECYGQSFGDTLVRDRIGWYDPKLENTMCFPTWRLLREHGAGVFAAPVGIGTRVRCCTELGAWSIRHRGALWHEAVWLLWQLPGATIMWSWKAKRTVHRINAVVEDGAGVIIVDDDTLGLKPWNNIRLIPFPEKDGNCWGRPVSDDAAIAELERLRGRDAHYIVFTKPSLWWLEYYSGFKDYLDENFSTIRNDRLTVIYDLQGK
jgi:glycosyltransferase involved in cell wall biosynthesis